MSSADVNPDLALSSLVKGSDLVVATGVAGYPTQGPAPKVSVGLPVYNGEEYLAGSLESLLAQTFTDFEIVISDNASTDSTLAICVEYAERDPRIRVAQMSHNIGASGNHAYVFAQARGEYFKWASHDDLYSPELLGSCLEALEAHPEAILAHCKDGTVDSDGKILDAESPYLLDSWTPDPVARFRSLLYAPGGNDFYGLMRTAQLRKVPPFGSYHNSDRTFMAELSLMGPFFHVPHVLYYRREHPGRATYAGSARDRSVVLDPRRANRLRHPLPRIYAEYVLGFVGAIERAPLDAAVKARLFVELGEWFGRAAFRGVTSKLRRNS